MQQSSVTAFSRETSLEAGRQWWEERSKQAASLVRDFQEWIEAVSFEGKDDSSSAATDNDLARHYVSMIDQTFKELMRVGAISSAPIPCRTDIAGPFGQTRAELKKVA